MKQSNNQVGEKVLVLGAGQLGASVLASLVPAVTQRNGSVSVIVSGQSRDKQSKRRSSIHQQLADAGARFIPVDIAGSSVAALKDQFHGFDTIINCMGFVAGAGTQIKIIPVETITHSVTFCSRKSVLTSYCSSHTGWPLPLPTTS